MKYEERKAKLRKLIRPEATVKLAECCGTPVLRAHKYAVGGCDCTRTFEEAVEPPRKVRKLLDVPPETQEALIRELVLEFADARKRRTV